MSGIQHHKANHRSEETLAVIAHKIARNTFDLSTGLGEYSIRDQIVRGALVGETLFTSGAYPAGASVLIIGAGAAGVSCAAALASYGINAYVLEVKDRPFSVFASAGHRYVSPFMYEWPSVFADQHSFLQTNGLLSSGSFPQFPDWNATKPVKASELAEKLTEWLESFLKSEAGQKLFIYTKCDPMNLKGFAVDFALDQTKHAVFSLPAGITNYSATVRGTRWRVPASLSPDCVILAAGAAKEKMDLFNGLNPKPFWTNDLEDLKNCDGNEVGVFGNGDGAFQDFLRYTFFSRHPLTLFQALPDEFRKQCEEKFTLLLSYEMAAKRFSIWGASHQALKLIEDKCSEIVEALVTDGNRGALVNALSAKVRKKTKGVTLVRSAKAGKCYLLNRFMVALVEMLSTDLSAASRTKIEIVKHEGHLANGAKVGSRWSVDIPGIGKKSFDHVIVRYGNKNKDDSLGRQVMMSVKDSAYPARVCFENLILPYEPYATGDGDPAMQAVTSEAESASTTA